MENLEEIKRKIKIENVILFLLTFIGVYIVFSVGLSILPKYKVSWSAIFISNINSVLLNLSYSYLAGLIFYVLISYLPELAKKKKFIPFIKKDILTIHSLFLGMINAMSSKNRHEIFENIPNYEVFQELMGCISPNELYPGTIGQVTEATYLKTFLYLKVESLHIIKHIHIFKDYIPNEIILLLENLYNSELFRVVVMWNSWRAGVGNQNMRIFSESFYDGFKIVKELKKEAEKL